MSRRGMVVLGIGVVVGLVAAASVVHGFQLDTAAGACYSPEPGETDCGGGPGDFFLIAGPTLFVVGLLALTLGSRIAGFIVSRGVRRTGRDATGTVISVSDTGTTINNSPLVRIGLDVTPADGSAPFKAETTKVVSRLSIPGPGDVFRVRYDPAHPGRVALMPGAPQGTSPARQIPGMPGVPSFGSVAAGRPWIDLSDPTRPAPGTPGGGIAPDQAATLMTTGEPAGATVLSATPLSLPGGLQMPGAGVYDLVLDVARADAGHYQAKTRIGFSTEERRDRVARAGAQIPVRIDPDDLSRVAVDTAALGYGMAPAAPVVPGVAPAGTGVFDELERLSALHASGTLTDAEFETLRQHLIQGNVP